MVRSSPPNGKIDKKISIFTYQLGLSITLHLEVSLKIATVMRLTTVIPVLSPVLSPTITVSNRHHQHRRSHWRYISDQIKTSLVDYTNTVSIENYPQFQEMETAFVVIFPTLTFCGLIFPAYVTFKRESGHRSVLNWEYIKIYHVVNCGLPGFTVGQKRF